MIELETDAVAPSYIKFYKYEEIKRKSTDLLTAKDKLRMKMTDKQKKLMQIPINEGPRGSHYVIDLEMIQKLKIMEEEQMQTRTQRKNSRQIHHQDQEVQDNDGDPHDPGLHRLVNIAARHKLLKALREPPVYMQPHKNKFIN